MRIPTELTLRVNASSEGSRLTSSITIEGVRFLRRSTDDSCASSPRRKAEGSRSSACGDVWLIGEPMLSCRKSRLVKETGLDLTPVRKLVDSDGEEDSFEAFSKVEVLGEVLLS